MHLQCRISRPSPFYLLKLAINLLSANTHTHTQSHTVTHTHTLTRQLPYPSHITPGKG